MSQRIFGIRHHGPGCARGLKAALLEWKPDVIVLEGPADAEEALPLAASEKMEPPVAMLLYPPGEPRRSVFYPFAIFSPEWQAIRWALAEEVPIRLMDLPQAIRIPLDRQAEEAIEKALLEAEAKEQAENEQEDREEAEVTESKQPESSENESTPEQPTRWRTDPLALLAEAAGYQDHELWWEEQIERRADATDLFDAILEAMQTVREHYPETTERDLLREAYMRTTIREVQKEGFERIAIICGAWHSPVLTEAALAGDPAECSSKEDKKRLKGLSKEKTVATWIPWTYDRLSYRSGYGAGINSPGWYAHVWEHPQKAPTRWLTQAARLLREQDLDASSASVIESLRLADSLAALRDLCSPGLRELNEAMLSVLCHGQESPLNLIREKLEVGDRLGVVSEETPQVPILEDLEKLQKSLRFKPTTAIRQHDFDLRKPTDLARSHLLHRLTVLEIPWGHPLHSEKKTSTFHELWQVQWQPEFAVDFIEASVWGNTIEEAATTKLIDLAKKSTKLTELTEAFDHCLLADLKQAIDPLLKTIQKQAAISSDVRHLMESLLPLARVTRYGNVRGTQADDLLPVLEGMFERACVGLLPACSNLSEEAAEEMLKSMEKVQQTLELLHREDWQADWEKQLQKLLTSDLHGLLKGWACRKLLEQGAIDEEALQVHTRLALSPANDPQKATAWATGLLRGSGLVLLHLNALWQVFDRWLSELPEETFIELAPLIRRAFSDFTPAERRQMGDKVKNLDQLAPTKKESTKQGDSELPLQLDRARRTLPNLAQFLGVPYDPAS
ncbi:Hypothetical protein PBC10988_21770 [Planctomycetales bacterium 10988]|nr:Hypothetical protein PBC10988_21770 [Planctomycetales bacterium 10988]